MKALLLIGAVGMSFALKGGETARRDSWGGLEPHPAVVNPVAREKASTDENLISLRGTWEFANRVLRNGRCPIRTPSDAYFPSGHGWEKFGANAIRQIEVPGAWETQGVGEQGPTRGWVCRWDCGVKTLRNAFQGEGWYRREVLIPKSWSGKRVWLKTGLISGYGYLWVNGHQVAHVDFYCGTAKYDVTPFVTPGEKAMIVVQAVNTGTSRTGGLSSMHTWGGILRDIELEATPQTLIDDAWVRGDFDNRAAEAHVVLFSADGKTPTNAQLRVTVEGASVSRAAEIGENVLRLPLTSFRAWSPMQPNLYWATIELLVNGEVAMTRRERFGVRKLEVVGSEFRLNGQPFFVRGCGWHNIYNIEGTAPADRDLYRRLVRRIRGCGFNACRFHTSCRPPELFEAADEVGLLLQPELPYYADTPATGQVFDPLGDAKELYANFRRHPSFAFYSGGNEGWFGLDLSKRLYREIKTRDPDRLMIGQDGWNNPQTNQRGTSDYQGGPMNVWPRGSVRLDTPFVAHEYLNLTIKLDSRTEPKYTGVVLPPTTRQARAAWLARFGLSLAEGDRLQNAMSVLQKTWFKYGIESARLDPECDGYSFWSLQDGGGKNGEAYSGQALFDPFMEKKASGFSVAEVAVFNSETCLLMDTDPRLYPFAEEEARFARNPFEMFLTDFATNRVRTAGETIDAHIFLAHYGEKDLETSTLNWKLVAGGQTLVSGSEKTGRQFIGGVREIAHLPIEVPAVEKPCRARFEVELSSSEGTVRNNWDWWLFPSRKKLDGSDVFVSAAFRSRLSSRFNALAETPEGAKVVIGPTNDVAVLSALARGGRVITLEGIEGETNIRLGWWWMGEQMGAVVAPHPALSELPNETCLTPLLFRLMKKGEALVPDARRKALLIYGEGGSACYSYLTELRHASGAIEMSVRGIDLLADVPEADSILKGLIGYLR